MKALQGMFVKLRKAPALQASALKARSRAAQGERAERSEALEPWVVDAIEASPERDGAHRTGNWHNVARDGSGTNASWTRRSGRGERWRA